MRPLLLAPFLALLLLLSPLAAAHKSATSPDGKIKLVWGFADEPALTGTPNAIDLQILDAATNAPIDGVTATTLRVEMHYGDEEFAFTDFGPVFNQHGKYTATVTPTQPGYYVLHLSGAINGSDLGPDGVEIQASHEVREVANTYFPAMNASANDDARVGALEKDVKELKDEVAALKAQLKTQATTPASTAPQSTPVSPTPSVALGAVALALVVVALAMRRRS